MPLIILMPSRVVQNFRERFPEAQHNAYGYFNYDHRVVEERVPRGDVHRAYQGPDDLTDAEYQSLVDYAKTLVNASLARYSMHVANEDALTMAIGSYMNGKFAGKVNANHFQVLLQAMGNPPRTAKKKSPGKAVNPSTLKQLGLKTKDLPLRQRVRDQGAKSPRIVKERGRAVMLEAPTKKKKTKST